MKTLDKVIEDAERCLLPFPGDCLNCPHFDSTDDDLGYDCQKKILRDAVGYLREFASQKSEKMANKSDSITETERNDPLSWDELRQMKGKPVWVEYSGYAPNWEIVENTGHFIETNMSILHKEDQGITWQAYRKERE